VLEKAKTQDEQELIKLEKAKKQEELDVMGKHKDKALEKVKTQEKQELAMLEKAKKQEEQELAKREELEKYQEAKRRLHQHFQDMGEQIANIKRKLEGPQQQTDESELQNKLNSLELNMEWTIKTLRNAKAASLFESEDEQDKNEAELLPLPEVLEEQELIKLEKAKKQEELENKTKVELVPSPEVLENKTKVELLPPPEVLEKAKTQEEQELAKLEKAMKQEELENETKVELPPPPKVLEKAKNQEEQELAKREELENKTKVELSTSPEVLKKVKTQEEQELAKLEKAKNQEEQDVMGKHKDKALENVKTQDKQELAMLEKAKKQEELENKTKVELPPPPEVMKGWKITKMKLKGQDVMDKHKAKMLEKAKNKEEQELTKREELENKTKVKLPPPPGMLDNAKTREKQDFNAQDFNEVKIFKADSFASFSETMQDTDKPNCSGAVNKKKTSEERENKINKDRFIIFDIFNFLGFGEEDNVNKTKFMIFEIVNFLDFGEDCNANKQIDVNNIAKIEINSCAIQKKKQEMTNKAVLYVNAFKQMLQDFKNKYFGDDGGNNQITVNKAVIYVTPSNRCCKTSRTRTLVTTAARSRSP
jgi:hypothetical protein